MPISQKQLEANRANAQKSTGPRTPEGKRRSSVNATKHGLYSKSTVINSPHLKENPKEYIDILVALGKELKPVGQFEAQLVRVIGDCLWRQRRALRAETARLNRDLLIDEREPTDDHLFDIDSDDPDITNMSEKERIKTARELSAAAHSIPTGRFSAELLRYELRADHRLSRAFWMLNQLQAKRKGVVPPSYFNIEPINKSANPMPQNPLRKNGHRFE